MELTKLHKTIMAAVSLMGLGAASVVFLPTRAEVHAIESRQTRHELEHDRKDIQKQVWRCRDKYGDDFAKASPNSREECSELEVELDDIKDKLRGGK